MQTDLIDVRIAAVHEAARDMKVYELTAVSGKLPAAGPGAHIDVHLPAGMVRQYSLMEATPHRYLLGIKREAGGRGGSRWLHDEAKPGTLLRAGAPRNHFPLRPEAQRTVLVAGGIGITPIWAMAHRLAADGRPFELHYGCRSRAYCAFHDDLLAWGDCVRFYFDDRDGPGAIDFAALAARAAADDGLHLYCCGPQGMLDAFERACAGLPPGRAHLEHFAAPAPPAGEVVAAQTFTVRLARSGREVPVPADKTILECLSAIGVDVPYSCSQGVCGSCETRVVDGEPEHRDVVLSAEERASNKTLMVCCSRSRSAILTLDL